jgi:hypothetical protein
MEASPNLKRLELYLRDHYAAAVGAMELIDHSLESHKGTPLATFFVELRSEVQSDQDQLHNLMERLGFEESSLRNAGAWLAEKLARAKLGFARDGTAELRLLQTLDSLFLGVTGKQLLWRTLQAIRDSSPVLEKTDFVLLEDRALDQLDKIEEKRLEAARESLGEANLVAR